jgi:hypothetical protein
MMQDGQEGGGDAGRKGKGGRRMMQDGKEGG